MSGNSKTILFVVVLFLAVIVYGVYYLTGIHIPFLNNSSWPRPTENPPQQERGISDNTNEIWQPPVNLPSQ